MSEPSTSNTHSAPASTPRSSLPWWFWRRVSLRYKRRARRHMKTVTEHSLNALDATLELAGDAAGDAGVPGLSSALSAVRVILQKIQTMKTNVEGVDALDANIVSLRDIFEEFATRRKGQQISDDTLEQIAELEKMWLEIAQQAGDIKSRGRIKRFFTSNADAKKLADLVERISTSIQEKFLLRSILNVKEDVHVIRRDMAVVREDVEVMREGVEAVAEGVEVVCQDVEVIREDMNVVREDAGVVRENVGVVRKDVELVREDVTVVREDVKAAREDVGAIRQDAGVIREDVGAVLEEIGSFRQDVKVILEGSFMTTYAKNARYDAGGAERRSCLEGTRVDVLNRLYAWIIAACTQTKAILEAGSIFWINGLAGTGKTTVAVSVAEWSEKRNLLAANFFCSRSDAECSDPNLIFPTLSRQLCSFHAPFKEKVATIVKDKPDLVHAGPLRQFEELIVRPLEAVKDTWPTSVIVLDALDECLDKETVSIILTAIAKFIPRIAGMVLFVVTSRPERRITVLFEAAAQDTLKDVTTPLLLHTIELSSVLNDIRRFLEAGFARESQVFAIDTGWPTAQDVNKLAEMSGGLFIWAATALRFIMDPNFSDPQGQLDSLLTTESTPRKETILDSLYSQITNTAFSKIAPTLSSRLRSILGTITLAKEPLSVGALATLVGLSEGVVRNAITGLGSVLHIPSNSTESIYIIHLTFPEFLLASSPTKPEAFCITPADHHLALFTRCMVIMGGLQRDIAGVKNPSAFKSEVPGLAKIVKNCIIPPMSYACRYWTTHLAQCVGRTPTDGDFNIFREFLLCHYLHWLEACSLLGVIESGVSALYTALQACQALGGRFADLAPLLVDCRRFALTYAACVDSAPLQLYHSALAVAPTKSLVRTAYAHELGTSPMVCRGAPSEWAPCLDVFEGHDGHMVCAVAFSPNGDCFITVGRDHKLRIWGPATRTMILSFDGLTDIIDCVAFSPDGLHVASGSGDGKIRVWTVSSGDCVWTLEGHTDWVYSVTYSADGQHILSSTNDGEVKLWNLADGRCILTLDPINSTVQAGISPNGGVIARGNETSLCLHDVSTSIDKPLDFPDEVEAATFSPTGQFVAARSEHAIRVWKCDDKSLVRSIDVPDDELFGRLAFSRDGTRIGCGSVKGPVYLWQVASDAPPVVLRGHKDSIFDLSWSPDGLQLVSVSYDRTIRVWDVTLPSTDAEAVVSRYHPSAIGSFQVALARHNGATALLHLPYASIDISYFSALASSLPEGAPVLTPFGGIVDAWDAVLQDTDNLVPRIHSPVWAAISGQQCLNFSADAASKQPMCMSPHGSAMAYVSPTSSEVVDVCNLHTGRVVTSLSGHTRGLRSLAFSPDSTLIATGSFDNTVKVWSASNGRRVLSHEEHTSQIQALAFSSDGRLVASGSDDKTVHVFEAMTGRAVRVFKSHRRLVIDVAFAGENAYVLTLDASRWFYIWDIVTGGCAFEISLEDDSWIHGLNFSLDGTGVLVVGGGHEEARTLPLWKPDSRTWPIYMVSKEGWLYEKGPGHTVRLGWLPPEWRDVSSLGDGKLFAPDFSRKRAVVLDVSQTPDYTHT